MKYIKVYTSDGTLIGINIDHIVTVEDRKLYTAILTTKDGPIVISKPSEEIFRMIDEAQK